MPFGSRPSCPSCGGSVTRRAFDGSGLGSCVACRAVVSCHRRVTILPRLDAAPPLAAVDRWTITESGDGVVLRKRWFGMSAIAMAAFTAAWDSIMVTMYVRDGFPIPPLFMPHVWAAVVMTYSSLAGFVNVSLLSADRLELRLRSGPLPVPGDRRFKAGDVDGIVAVEDARGRGSSFDVRVVLKDGRMRSLIDAGGAWNARCLRASIERGMGLAGREMAPAPRATLDP